MKISLMIYKHKICVSQQYHLVVAKLHGMVTVCIAILFLREEILTGDVNLVVVGFG